MYWRNYQTNSAKNKGLENYYQLKFYQKQLRQIVKNNTEILTWTVILVVMAGSIMAANSWAAKILNGLFQKSKTDMNSLSQILCNLRNANSLSSASEILYLKTKFQFQGDIQKEFLYICYKFLILNLSFSSVKKSIIV